VANTAETLDAAKQKVAQIIPVEPGEMIVQQVIIEKPEPKEYKGKKAVPYFCQKDSLALLGTAESLQAAPFNDPNTEIWAVAVCTTYPICKRVDLLFELHGSGYWTDKNVLTRLKKETVPIYMHEKYRQVPNAIRYPIEIITQYSRYFTNSIAYMLALAYHSFKATGKPEHVAMFGIHMAAEEEYTDQRPNCEYWIGIMRGAGMIVDPSPGGAVLGHAGLYGYEDYHPICYEFRQRITGLNMGHQKAIQERDRWQYQVAKQEGAIQENNYWLRRHQTGNIPRNKE
jgi:hypothetical protein